VILMIVILSDPFGCAQGRLRERRISAMRTVGYCCVRFFVATASQNDRRIIFTLLRY
jgi:hypothetical protein